MEKTGTKEKISYGLGSMAITLVNLVFLKYWIEFLGNGIEMEMTDVGIVLMMGGGAGFLGLLLSGFIIDKTSTRWGKARTYLLWMTVPFALPGILMALLPLVGGKGAMLYGAVLYMMFLAAQSFLFVSLTSMLGSMAEEESERVSFGVFYMLGIGLGVLLSKILNGPVLEQISSRGGRSGYVVVTSLCAAACAGLLLLCFRNTRERISGKSKGLMPGRGLKAVLTQKNCILLLVIFIIGYAGVEMQRGLTAYYVDFCVRDRSIQGSPAELVYFLALPLVFVVMAVMKKYGMKKCFQLGTAVYCVSMFGLFLKGEAVWMLLLCSTLWRLGVCVMCVSFLVMAAKSLDILEVRKGIRPGGLLIVMILLGRRLAGGIAASLMGTILAQGGYNPMDSRPADTVLGAVRAGVTWVPLLFLAVCGVLSLFCSLDRD